MDAAIVVGRGDTIDFMHGLYDLLNRGAKYQDLYLSD